MQNILIADDNISILEILKLSLKQLGYQVKTVSNKSDLLWTLRNFKPDLVILDVFLDKEDGREICRKIREKYHLGSIPIILFSSNKYALTNFKDYGADDCVEKPFELEELFIKIKQTLGKIKS